MNSEALKQIAERWIDSFNNHDVESILLLYSDQAEHYSPKLKVRQPETGGIIRGKDSMRQWWKESFKRFPKLHYKLIRLTPYGDRVFLEYLRQASGDEDLQVGEMLIITNGLIVESRVYHS